MRVMRLRWDTNGKRIEGETPDCGEMPQEEGKRK